MLIVIIVQIHESNNNCYFHRNMKREVWNPIFETLLNVNPATDLPMNFSAMRASLIEAFDASLHPSIQSLITFKNYITKK